MNKKGEILIYKPRGAGVQLDVKLEEESVWLSQAQMAKLFEKTKQAVSLHINNIFKEKELSRKGTVKEYLTVQKEGKRQVKRKIEYYNLDVIISVGYRVKSKRGTQFRIWATGVLKEYLIKGYSVNEKKLQEQTEKLKNLQKTADLMGRLLETHDLDNYETAGLLKVITDYSYALTVLDNYDHHKLKINRTTKKKEFKLTYKEARKAIDKLVDEFSKKGEKTQLVGKEKDQSFQGALGNLYQTFDGKPLYRSIEEKAAHLLYFVVKNHSFIDGNKRIAAFLFIWYLELNGLLYRQDGTKRLGDNALVALTLMIAESRPEDKDIIAKVVVNLINKDN